MQVANIEKHPEDPLSSTMVLNMGPQHPSTHGVLRLKLHLDGEIIKKVEPVIGYLHRGIEKLCENRSYHKALPLTDRLDYTGAFSMNLGYILAVEKLLGIEAPPRARAIRVLLNEIARIGAHMVWIGSSAADTGALTVFLYAFMVREQVYDLSEAAAGGRMTLSYFRAGGLHRDIPAGYIDMVRKFTDELPGRVDEFEKLLTRNRIFMERTMDIGVISGADALDLGVTGPTLRASGVDYDLRKVRPYSGYELYDFDVPVGIRGDVYERYLVRLEEIRQSNRIIRQAVESLPDGPVLADEPGAVLPPKERVMKNMEDLIRHYKLISEGFRPPAGEVYHSTEAPKGELGFYIVSDGSENPVRLKIRTPSFGNLQALPCMLEGRYVADIPAIIGSIDIVLGEIDR